MTDNTPQPAQPQPSDAETARARLELVNTYLRDGTLIAGVDYGIIPGTNGKPSLMKPGAQKLCALFDLATEIKDLKRVLNDTMVLYEVIVLVRNKLTGVAEAEGVGECSSRERRYSNKGLFDISNTVLKMAKKRAMVDAVLDALGVSSLFTQDLEDMDYDSPPPVQQRQRAEQPHQNGNGRPAQQAAPPPAQRQQPAAQQQRVSNGNGQGAEAKASTTQLDAINAIARLIWGEGATRGLSAYMNGTPPGELTKSEASDLIRRLQGERNNQGVRSAPPAQQQPAQRHDEPMMNQAQYDRIVELSGLVFGASGIADAERLAGKTMAELTAAEADDLAGKLQTFRDSRRAQTAPETPQGTRLAAPAPAPAEQQVSDSVKRLRDAMRETGAPYTRPYMAGWLVAINTYRRDQYDAPEVDRISHIPENEIDDIIAAVNEGIIFHLSDAEVEAGMAAA